jgi:RNA polymerase sigma-70 factor (ECF subfamily)
MTPSSTHYGKTGSLEDSNENPKIRDGVGLSKDGNKYEIELWEEFKQGNESSFILIYKLYFGALIAYGSQFTRDKNIIKDAVQDLFIDLRKKRSQLSSLKYSLKYYLYKSLKNNILQYLRKGKLIEKHHYNFAIDQLTADESIESRIVQTQEYTELKKKLKAAQMKLTNRQREALFYLYYENLTYAEIQKLMLLKTVKSARNLIYSAVRGLREHMTQ